MNVKCVLVFCHLRFNSIFDKEKKKSEKNFSSVILSFSCLFCVYVSVDQLDALSFLIDKRVYKPFKTKCEEQKREAKAAYESRCEPSVHIRLTDKDATKRRYCPDLKDWPVFSKYEVN